MSLKEFFNNLHDSEIDLAWCHWNRLGVLGHGKVNKCSTDPEALILLTSIVGKYDLRLAEVMNEWLWNYESIVSVERLKKYIRELQTDKDTPDDIFHILRDSISNLDVKRWQSITDLLGGSQSTSKRETSRKKLEEHDKIIKNNRQLFLRLMFGVGSRADIIYYASIVWNLEKNPFSLQISASNLTRMLHYNNSSIFRTLGDLERAGIFVIDQKTISGKNKVYLPNIQTKGSNDIFGTGRGSEKAFVDWLAIAKICLLIESLENNLADVSDDSIIKSRMNDFITSCSAMVNDACIDIKDSISIKALAPALVHVGLDELQSKIVAMIDGVYGFVSI